MNVILRLFAAKASLMQVTDLEICSGTLEKLVLLTAGVSAKTRELSPHCSCLCSGHDFASVAHCIFCVVLWDFDCDFPNQSLESV